MDGFHVAITRRVRPGKEAQFVDALREFIRESLTMPGVRGALLISPHAAGDVQTYGILRTFDDESASDRFYESEQFRQWEERVALLVEGDSTRRRLDGLAPFFYGVKGGPPPKWKMALVTWIGVFPAVLLWSGLLKGSLQGLPPLAAVAIVNACVVATLAWIAMPLLTHAFAPWLAAKSS